MLGTQQLTVGQLTGQLLTDDRFRADKPGRPRLQAILRGMVASGVLGKRIPEDGRPWGRFDVPVVCYAASSLVACANGVPTWGVRRGGALIAENMTEAEAKVCAAALNEHDRKVRGVKS